MGLLQAPETQAEAADSFSTLDEAAAVDWSADWSADDDEDDEDDASALESTTIVSLAATD